MSKTDMLAEIDDEIIIMDQFQDALIGYVERFGQPPVALYDKDGVLDILMADGLTLDDAIEWFDFNIIGGYLGDYTPAFCTLFPSIDD